MVRRSVSLVVAAFSVACVRPPSVSINPIPDPRVGLRAGLNDAAVATWNMRLLSNTPSPGDFRSYTNSDLAFTGHHAIQGNYHGFLIWDISNPRLPNLEAAYTCPASQNDVSVYRNLLFVSVESGGRLDCGTQRLTDTVSMLRMKGLRIFDISDLRNPKYIASVQTCRGSHTHSLLVDAKDAENVYVYISGSGNVRSPTELPGCRYDIDIADTVSALFHLEVIKVPLAHPEKAAVVSSPRIFENLMSPKSHGEAPEEIAATKRAVVAAKARGEYTAVYSGAERPLSPQFTATLLDSIVLMRHGTGAPTARDSATLRRTLPAIVAKRFVESGPRPGPTQCHDITLYPAIGLAGGACEGYGFLLDIGNPAHPRRIAVAADSNFSFWHSATFNYDGTKLLFSDEWGAGYAPKCRATDPREWGADAIFTRDGNHLQFHSYYKLPAVQTSFENCVAHNGSLIPVPGRDVMVQAWYQGGVSVFDFTDADHPREIAFFDRGPVDSTRWINGGAWSAYWYNGVIVSSEIARGLDILELTPNALLSQNEIDAAKSVRLDYFNTQGQPKFGWPATFALARAYVDQLERAASLDKRTIARIRSRLITAEQGSSTTRREKLEALAKGLGADHPHSRDASKVASLRSVIGALAAQQ